MTYPALLAAVGCTDPYPEAGEIYRKAEATGELYAPLQLARVPALFGEIAGDVLAAARLIEASRAWLAYTHLLRLAYVALPADKIPLLAPEEGNIPRNFAPLLALVAHVDTAVCEMEKRGIPKDMQERVNGAYCRMASGHKRDFGFLGIRPLHFFWAKHYLHPDIFGIGSLEFEITRMPQGEGLFQSRRTGELVPLRRAALTGGAYCGITPLRGGGDGEARTLTADEYEPLAFSGDDVLSVHIPGGARIAPATCRASFCEALDFFSQYYPERRIRAFFCRSWLMDPELADVLPEGANILAFQRLFLRYPTPATGREVFTFVHPQPFATYEELPENTTLLRGLKRRYLAGRPIYLYAGVIPLGKQD